MKTDTKELAAWLRENSSGSYRQCAEAADRLEQHGDPSDAADPNGSTYARLKWWKDRTDDLHDQLAAKDAHADEIYKAAVNLAKKLEDDLAAERALADSLAGCISHLAAYDWFIDGTHSHSVACSLPPQKTREALAAWKEARSETP
jgi:hypothetical protein